MFKNFSRSKPNNATIDIVLKDKGSQAHVFRRDNQVQRKVATEVHIFMLKFLRQIIFLNMKQITIDISCSNAQIKLNTV